MTYGYNPRGWLSEGSSALFKQYLKYNETISGVTAQYNGNISRQEWQQGTSALQNYTYAYDRLGRLTEGTMAGSVGRETVSYEYFLKDHLSKLRSGFTSADPTVASVRSDYYPFGLQYQSNILVGSPKNRYLYNEKELQDGNK